MDRLFHRVQPHPGEDGYGFLVRVVHANYLKGGPANLLELICEDSKEIRMQDMPRIANYCLNSVAELSQLSGVEVCRTGGEYIWQINGELITKSAFLASRYSKICPKCLGESNYLRGSWSLTFYTACPTHKTSLIDSCGGCGKRLKWNRRFIEYCGCGYPLKESQSHTASPSSIFIASLIEHRFNQETLPTRGLLADREIDRLTNLSLDGLCKTLWFLGHCIFNLGSYGPGHGRKILTIDEADQMINQAIKLLHQWPHNLGNRLSKLSMRQPSKSSASLIERLFGPAQSYLQSEITTDELFYVRTAYEQHIRKVWRQFDTRNQSTLSTRQMELDATW